MSVTLRHIYRKMRRQNQSQCLLMFLCYFVSILLITAYGVVMESPTIRNVLPEGGDSRKMLYMIFALTLLGCLIFINYASGLFLRFKSREFGIFMALGAEKKQLQRLLSEDLLLLTACSAFGGLLLGVPLAVGIWNFFRFAIINTKEMVFSISWSGLLYGLFFAGISITAVFLKGVFFIGRTNILDVIKEQRKSEPVKDVKFWYGWGGILMILLGGFLGYYHSAFFIQVLKYWPPVWANVVYAFVPVGLYLFLLYTVIRGWSGKNSYKNIVSKSIMKFQGRQTVRNMCIIALLTAGGLFAMFYAPITQCTRLYSIGQRTFEYAFFYRGDEEMVTQKDIEKLAEKHQVPIHSYTEISSATVARDGYRDLYSDSGAISEEYVEQLSECQIVSASDYKKLTGKTLDPAPGEFCFLDSPESSESTISITQLTNPVTGKVLPVKAAKVLPEYSILLSHLVLNDSDYKEISRGLTPQWQEEVVCFHGDKDSENAYLFSRELFDQILAHSSKDCEISDFYDRITKAYYESEGITYEDYLKVSYEDADSMGFANSWKYYPDFSPMDVRDSLKNLSVFLMTFLFIFLICLMSVLVILYTRSITLGLSCRQVYEDLKRLGASRAYLRKSVSRQLFSVFVSPTLTGAIGIWGYFLLVLYANSGSISSAEWIGAGVCFLLVLALAVILFFFYRRVRNKVYRMLNI